MRYLKYLTEDFDNSSNEIFIKISDMLRYIFDEYYIVDKNDHPYNLSNIDGLFWKYDSNADGKYYGINIYNIDKDNHVSLFNDLSNIKSSIESYINRKICIESVDETYDGCYEFYIFLRP